MKFLLFVLLAILLATVGNVQAQHCQVRADGLRNCEATSHYSAPYHYYTCFTREQLNCRYNSFDGQCVHSDSPGRFCGPGGIRRFLPFNETEFYNWELSCTKQTYMKIYCERTPSTVILGEPNPTTTTGVVILSDVDGSVLSSDSGSGTPNTGDILGSNNDLTIDDNVDINMIDSRTMTDNDIIHAIYAIVAANRQDQTINAAANAATSVVGYPSMIIMMMMTIAIAMIMNINRF